MAVSNWKYVKTCTYHQLDAANTLPIYCQLNWMMPIKPLQHMSIGGGGDKSPNMKTSQKVCIVLTLPNRNLHFLAGDGFHFAIRRKKHSTQGFVWQNSWFPGSTAFLSSYFFLLFWQNKYTCTFIKKAIYFECNQLNISCTLLREIGLGEAPQVFLDTPYLY